MFPPYPGFEGVVIRLDIDWAGRRRPIEIRFEQWPQSRRCVLVCRFADEPEYGEWIIWAGWGQPYFVGKPEKLLFNLSDWGIVTRRPQLTRQFKDKSLEAWKNIVRRAFKAADSPTTTYGVNSHIARILELPDLPAEPRFVLWHSNQAWWFCDWTSQEKTRFEWEPSPLYLSSEQMLAMVKHQWNELGSPARFAWEWDHWTEEERFQHMTGYKGLTADMSQVMKWIMVATSGLWEIATGWTWNIQEPDLKQTEMHRLYHQSNPTSTIETDDELLAQWPPLLLKTYAPRWRGDWLANHVCAKDFWGYRPLCEVEITEPPTMHERLEARFHLREWLLKNAPERMDLLP